MRNLHGRFDRYYIGQIYSGDFAKICGLLRIYELYYLEFESHIKFKCLLETPQREIYWAFMKWDSFKLAEPRIDDRNHEWNRPDFRTN